MPWDIEATAVDILVIGGGLAGLGAAAEAARRGRRVALVQAGAGASPFVLGVNAALGHAEPRDSPEAHFADTVEGGYGLNDPALVRQLVEEAPRLALDLAAAGVPFAMAEGRFRQRHLSGNRWPRSVFVETGTGPAILQALAARFAASGGRRWTGWRALALLQDGERVAGALLHDGRRGRLLAVGAGAVVLASGGIGRLYADSTYPADVACDSFGLALDAGAALLDMEFVQFEPTVVVHPAGCAGMEMPTAMLGDGAALLDAAGERFMFRHNPDHGERRIEKARLALCIQGEIEAGRGLPDGTVLFDTTRLPPAILEGYVSHCRRLRAAGLDPAREAPRIRPAAHSIMGGIAVTPDGATGVPGLFACGEAAGGVHGASRLAGNGGAEVLVSGHAAGRAVARQVPAPGEAAPLARAALDRLRAVAREGFAEAGLAPSLARRMSAACGLRRAAPGLDAALAEVRAQQRDAGATAAAPDTGVLAAAVRGRHLLRSAEAILRAALLREESRGAHQRSDHPATTDAWLRHVVQRDADLGAGA